MPSLFWRAGDIFPNEEEEMGPIEMSLERSRVHPRFLHSNATSHKWALGAFVELLDNSIDEIATGNFIKNDLIIMMLNRMHLCDCGCA